MTAEAKSPAAVEELARAREFAVRAALLKFKDPAMADLFIRVAKVGESEDVRRFVIALVMALQPCFADCERGRAARQLASLTIFHGLTAEGMSWFNELCRVSGVEIWPHPDGRQ